MSQYLPYGGFRWLSQKEIDKFDVNSFGENGSVGCILEVDLEYPHELHELQNNYSLAPEKLEISHNMLSNYCSGTANSYGIKIGGVNKLVPNLGSKSKNVLHYRNLHLYLSLGMKLTKNVVAIHEIKPGLTLDKPIYIGFSILGLSKLLMYEFHYEYIKSKYGVNLLFADTDSLVYEIKTVDVYEDFFEDKNVLIGFSDYLQDLKFLNPVNKKVIGKMKDEFKGKIISEFIGLK